MKSLDEVIAMLESGSCKYHVCQDALRYLKQYQMDFVDKSDWVEWMTTPDEVQNEENKPLTWDELTHMFGKPVWIEQMSKQYGGWIGGWKVINCYYTPWREDDGSNPLWMTDSSLLYKSDLGITWEAYRKEIEE